MQATCMYGAEGIWRGGDCCFMAILARGCQILNFFKRDARNLDFDVKDTDFQTFATIHFVL